MRVYQGIDIVEVARLGGVIERHKGFIDDIFTEEERDYCLARRRPYLHFAGRFAAKESYLKALGTGFPGAGIDLVLKEVEVVLGESGRPKIRVVGWAARLTEARKIMQTSVSITHAGDYALAAVVLVAAEEVLD